MNTGTRPEPLGEIREQIEAIDSTLVGLLARRRALALRAGEAKRHAGLPTLDPAHEAAVVRRAADSARSLGLPEEPVRHLFWLVVDLCRRAQQETT